MKNILPVLLLAPFVALAASDIKLDPVPVNLRDTISLQRGAHIFINYCLTCHNAAYMRYNRLQDLELSEQQIKDNLMFAVAKRVGDDDAACDFAISLSSRVRAAPGRQSRWRNQRLSVRRRARFGNARPGLYGREDRHRAAAALTGCGVRAPARPAEEPCRKGMHS